MNIKAFAFWEDVLDIDLTPMTIKSYMQRINVVTNSAKLRSFQYRLVHKALVFKHAFISLEVKRG